jgi:4'-phosphopantetheinyl transferase
MQSRGLSLWWGGPAAARDYRPELLRACDVARAALSRAPRAEQEWRVSRALMQRALPAREQAGTSDSGATVSSFSLSHRAGHALLAVAPAGWRVGVDLEADRSRDVAALAAWCCTAEEMTVLRAHAGGAAQRECFYLLWTLKEAFVKAAGLDFPADMKSVGIAPRADGSWALRAPGGDWRVSSVALEPGWIATAVWQVAAYTSGSTDAADSTDAGTPAWHAHGAALPARRALWCWPG